MIAPVGIDDQDGSTQHALQPGRAGIGQVVRLTEVAIEIAQQDQVFGQAELRAPGVVRPGRIDADAEHLRTQGTELFDLFSELGKLVGSTRAEIEDVGKQYDRAAGQRFGQADRLLAAHGQLEVRSGLADAQMGHGRRDYFTRGAAP